MFQVKSINKVFKEDNIPVTLIQAKGYFYYLYDLPEHYVFETTAVYVNSLGQLTKDEWIRRGREFAVEVEYKKGVNR